MSYHANIEAAVAFTHTVWPGIRERFPEWRLTLAGLDPAPAVLALRGEANVEVTGTVEDVRPYYREAVAAYEELAEAYEALRRFPERERLMKGLYGLLGFASRGVPYTPPARTTGAKTATREAATEAHTHQIGVIATSFIHTAAKTSVQRDGLIRAGGHITSYIRRLRT